MKRLLIAGICASLIGSSVQAQKLKGCATDAEARAIILWVAPVAFRGVQRSCAIVLPDNSFVFHPPANFVTSLETSATEEWPNVLVAISHLANGQGVPLEAPYDSFTRRQTEDFVAPLMKVNTSNCVAINRILELEQPLPIDNLVGMIIEWAKIRERSELSHGEKVDFPVCVDGFSGTG